MVPVQWKSGLILCLLHSAKVICSSQILFELEVNKIKKMFMNNGYPLSFFSKTLDKFRSKMSTKETVPTVSGQEVEQVSKEKKWKLVLKIPFVGQASYKLQNQMISLLKSALDVDVRPVFTSFKISNYFSLKCSTPFAYRSNVVYQFTCLSDQTVSYIGETTRHLKTRANEHLKTNKDKSQVWIHTQNCSSCKTANLSVDNFKFFKSCKGWIEAQPFLSLFL